MEHGHGGKTDKLISLSKDARPVLNVVGGLAFVKMIEESASIQVNIYNIV